MTKFTLYKIYYECGLMYIGRTKQPLQSRLRGHFFKKPMQREIDIELVTRIGYAEFESEADMFLYEVYYINKLKPSLNCDDKARDELTVDLPYVEFVQYDCKLMEKWKTKINEDDREYERKRKERIDNEVKLRELRKRKSKGEVSEEEYYQFKESMGL